MKQNFGQWWKQNRDRIVLASQFFLLSKRTRTVLAGVVEIIDKYLEEETEALRSRTAGAAGTATLGGRPLLRNQEAPR